MDVDSYPEPFKTRIKVWRHTESICKKLPTPPPSTKMFVRHYEPIRRYESTRVEVRDEDSLAAARSLLQTGKKIAVLNLADESIPLSCINTGSGAQEESLGRRSNLCQHLDIHMYPIEDNAGIYSQDVVVFRDTEANRFALIKPFKVDVITVPGVRHPCLDEHGHMKSDDRVRMRNKITLMYEMAQIHKIDYLVLGASSCGAWKANPREVAEDFKQVGKKFDGTCERVIFAILKPAADMLFTHRAPTAECNYGIFQSILEESDFSSVAVSKAIT